MTNKTRKYNNVKKNMTKETREERIARRKKEGYNNPKKDKWARRPRFVAGERLRKGDLVQIKEGKVFRAVRWYHKVWGWIWRLLNKLLGKIFIG